MVFIQLQFRVAMNIEDVLRRLTGSDSLSLDESCPVDKLENVGDEFIEAHRPLHNIEDNSFFQYGEYSFERSNPGYTDGYINLGSNCSLNKLVELNRSLINDFGFHLIGDVVLHSASC